MKNQATKGKVGNIPQFVTFFQIKNNLVCMKYLSEDTQRLCHFEVGGKKLDPS